jgi:hypothetical protein
MKSPLSKETAFVPAITDIGMVDTNMAIVNARRFIDPQF